VTDFRTIVILAGAAILALSAGYATHWMLTDGSPATTGLSEASDIDALFATQLPDLSGNPTSVSRWRGKVLVVNFWATWCAPCKEEIPEFVALQKEFASRNVQFVGIAADHADKVVPFTVDYRINYPILIGNIGALDLSTKLGNRISALPFTVVIDRNGRLAHRQLGILKSDKLRSIFAKLT
jgi:thiol-disulfide isomerase/thioredoxin